VAGWRIGLVAGAVAFFAALVVSGAGAAVTPVHVSVYAQSGIKLTDVVWTGRRFLFVENTTNTLYAAPPSGTPLTQVVAMPNMSEETRCLVSPGKYGYPVGVYYCHAPDNTIYRITPDGTSMTKLAQLPETATSDGALTFDTGGAFGHMLVAATGRSGGTTPAGGTVFTISASGSVTKVGSYSDPGGADEIAIAPPGFGSVAGEALLTVDAGDTGTVVAMDAKGIARTIARLPDGPNPIAVVTRTKARTTQPPPGFYVTDTNSMNVFFVAAADLAPYAGNVIVGTELKGQFWIIRPRGNGFQTRRLPTDLTASGLNLEAGTWVP
jgi:hypothetical protein